MRAYVKRYDLQTRWMYFLIENEALLQKYNIILEKISADIKKEFDSTTVYYKKSLEIKRKSHGPEVTNFYNKNVSNVNSDHTCLAVINLDSSFKNDENYYLWVFLIECKYIEKKVIRHIGNFYSSDESEKE